MRKKFQKRYLIQSEINIVPFLDILLILLVIFMMIPSQLLQSFEVSIPSSTIAKNIVNNKVFLTIEIKEIGLFNIIFNDKYIKNICLDKLHSEINNIICVYPDIVCLIAAAKNSKYESIIKVLNLLNNIGIHSVSMITNSVNLS